MDDVDAFLRERAERDEQLLRQLEASPIMDVLGVVDPNGVGGVQSPSDEHWSLRFSLACWRQAGLEVHDRPLQLCKPVTEAELQSAMQSIAPYAVVQLRARVAEDNVVGSPQAMLVEVIRVDAPDSELQRLAQQLQQPVTFHDTTLGVFTLDRRVDWFEALVPHATGQVRVTLEVDPDLAYTAALSHAHAMWASLDGWLTRARICAEDDLLELKNEYWLADGEAPLSRDQFSARMALESIGIDNNGNVDLWYEDGGLFRGHSIVVKGTVSQGPTDAGIHG